MRVSLPVHKNGQSLIEVLVSMTVAILVITGLVGAVLVAVRNTQFAKNQSLATKYAQEGMENTRQLRDTDWAVFWGKRGTIDEENPIPNTRFVKRITFEDISGGNNDKMKVTVTVSWTDSSGIHKSELISYFTKSALWR